MLFGVCVEHEQDRIMFIAIGYSFKTKNNCNYDYMNKTFYGRTPNVNMYFTSTPSSTRVLDTGSVAKY